MKNILLGLAFVSLLPAATCREGYPPEPPVVIFPPFEDAGVDAELPDIDPLCRLACENLARIGCPESAPAGRSCSSVCTVAERTGTSLNTTCVANASTPDQVRACGTVDCEGR